MGKSYFYVRNRYATRLMKAKKKATTRLFKSKLVIPAAASVFTSARLTALHKLVRTTTVDQVGRISIQAKPRQV